MCGRSPKAPSSTKLGMWLKHRQDQPPNTFRKNYRKSDMVKMWENAPVYALFYQLFDFGLNLGTLNGLLAMQNHDTPGGKLSQGFREASCFKIAYSCAILQLLTWRNLSRNRQKFSAILNFRTHFLVGTYKQICLSYNFGLWVPVSVLWVSQ